MLNSAKTVSAKASINSVGVPVSQLTLTHSIDDLPQANVVMQIDNSKSRSTEINVPVFTKFCANMQNYLCNKFRNSSDAVSSIRAGLQPDLKIEVIDGDGNTLNFSGFVGRPQLSVVSGFLRLSMAGVHSAAAMQNFSVGLYPSSNIYAQPQLVVPVIPNSIADRTKVILDNILRQFDSKTDLSFPNYAELAPTHAVNKAVHTDYIRKFLEASKERTLVPLTQRLTRNAQEESLSTVPGSFANMHLLGILMGAQNFMAAIPAICNAFKFQFNASWDGEAWMEVIRMHEEPDGRAVMAPIEDIKFDVAASIEAPISRVYVRAGRLPIYGQGNEPASLRQLATYPPINPEFTNDVPSVGVAYIVDAPPWLAGIEAINNDMVEDPITQPLSLTKGLSKLEKLDKSFVDQMKNRQNLLDWIAEYTYKEHFLKYTSAYVTLPLCLPVQVGKTYQVRDSFGNHIFTGYLTTVSHTINVDPQSSMAKTGLSFSHVKANGFVKTTPVTVGRVITSDGSTPAVLA